MLNHKKLRQMSLQTKYSSNLFRKANINNQKTTQKMIINLIGLMLHSRSLLQMRMIFGLLTMILLKLWKQIQHKNRQRIINKKIINKANKFLRKILSRKKENKNRKRKKKIKSILVNFKINLLKETNLIKIGDLDNMRNFVLTLLQPKMVKIFLQVEVMILCFV